MNTNRHFNILFTADGIAYNKTYYDALLACQAVTNIDMNSNMYLRGIYLHTGAYGGPESLTRRELRNLANVGDR